MRERISGTGSLDRDEQRVFRTARWIVCGVGVYAAIKLLLIFAA
jgi:hypothetical protein